MEGAYSIVEQEHGILVRFKEGSEVTPDLIIEAMDSENGRYPIVGRYDLWDFRGCPPSDDFDYQAMLKIIHHIETHYNDEWSTKTAILVDEAIQFGLSRMFQILIDDFPTQVAIFLDEAKARHWIREKGETP